MRAPRRWMTRAVADAFVLAGRSSASRLIQSNRLCPGPDVEVVALIIPAGSPINRLQLGDGTTEPGPHCQFASKLFAATIPIQSVVSDVL
jgi:hypothetical protein